MDVDPEDVPAGWTLPPVWDSSGATRWRSVGAASIWSSRGKGSELSARAQELIVEDYGWPFRCMRRVVATDTGFLPVPPAAMGLPPPPGPPPPLPPGPACIGLPTRVLWTGFAANTGLAAAVLLVLLGLIRIAGAIVRRAIAYHRRCPECGYNPANARGPLTTCPGCGRAWS